jgi:hypothetical protein
MGIFSRAKQPGPYSKHDSGKGHFDDYKYELIPKNKHITLQLAGSDECQDEIARVAGLGAEKVTAFIARRTADEERTDAVMPVRLFVDSRMTSPVGMVPRGFEAVVSEALGRLEDSGRSTRIPVKLLTTKHGFRVKLLMGETR